MAKIYTLDLNFQGVPNTIGSYVVQGESGLVMIETGPASCLDAAQAELAKHGFSVSDIKHVLLTHIHFDHAGAAGWWAAQGAHIYVHHVGAKHMIDPSRLVASAKRIYGDEMDRLYGELLPIDPANLTALSEGDLITVGDLSVECLDTPGHASHHMAYRLGNRCFSGDVGGTRLANRPMVDIPAAPPEFDLVVWLESVQRLKDYQFEELYPTHFGGIIGAENVETHLTELQEFIPSMAGLIRGEMEAGNDRDQIVEAYSAWQQARAKAAGFSDDDIHRYLTATPPDMSVDGVRRYWTKRWEREAGNS